MKPYVCRYMEVIKEWLQTFHPTADKKCLVIYGGVGVGKTYAVRWACNEVGYKLVTPDDVEEAFRLSRAKSWVGRLAVHLDRPYRLGFTGRLLKDLIKKATNPIIIEDEESKYYSFLLCLDVKAESPPKFWIIQKIKRKAVVKPNYRLISDDVRQSLLLAYGSQGYESITWFEALRRLVKEGVIKVKDRSLLPAILDTGLEVLYGVDLAKLMLFLAAADYGSLEVLEGVKIKAQEPNMYFYRKVKALKEGSNT